MSVSTVLVNGIAQDQIPVVDRGLQYGDGVFETIAVVDGVPQFWREHFARLADGCRRLNIPIPESKILEQESQQLVRKNGFSGAVSDQHSKCVLKIIVTRGAGGRGYRAPSFEAARPTRILSVFPWPDYPQRFWKEGIELYRCKTTMGKNPALVRMKHLNRLENVLARSEWDNLEIPEGILCDEDGNLVEGVMSNLFLIKDSALHTPDLSQSGVAGIMRGQVIRAAEQLQIPVFVRTISIAEIAEADGMFCTNSLIGMWPVRKVREQEFSVPNRLTEQLMQQLSL